MVTRLVRMPELVSQGGEVFRVVDIASLLHFRHAQTDSLRRVDRLFKCCSGAPRDALEQLEPPAIIHRCGQTDQVVAAIDRRSQNDVAVLQPFKGIGKVVAGQRWTIGTDQHGGRRTV